MTDPARSPIQPPPKRNVAAENEERAAFIYDKARQSGITDETAREMARDLSDPTPQRANTMAEWSALAQAPTACATKYKGPAPSIDCALWLKKIAWTLSHEIAQQLFAKQDLPIITNCRVRLDDSSPGATSTTGWWTDGCLRLDLQHRHVGGRREFTTCFVPVAACINHDTRWVIRKILAHISGPTVRMVETAILRETDLLHVHGE